MGGVWTEGKEDVLLESVLSEMPRQRDMLHMLPKEEEKEVVVGVWRENMLLGVSNSELSSS